ncbi:MAG: pyrimidine 5'-nucleotidase [Chloroflexi bacterium]|nr:pyrimidine 5'-nucleotidase [Chloroflexota bacterium]
MPTPDARLRFILFDLDDTLYPRCAGLMTRVHELMDDWMVRRLGITREEAVALRTRFYRKYGTTMTGLLVEHHIDADDFLHHVHDFQPSAFLKPNPALRRALTRIPLRRVIFTNGTRAHAQRVLEALDIAPLFERIIDVADIGYVSKPAPKAYQRALEILDATARECILVEDSPRNLVPAREMGMTTILVGNEPAPEADHHVQDVTQVADVVAHILNARRSEAGADGP